MKKHILPELFFNINICGRYICASRTWRFSSFRHYFFTLSTYPRIAKENFDCHPRTDLIQWLEGICNKKVPKWPPYSHARCSCSLAYHPNNEFIICFHEFWIYEYTNIFHETWCFIFWGCKVSFSVMINSYISNFDLNRKLLSCQKTKQKSILWNFFEVLYIQNSWRHVINYTVRGYQAAPLVVPFRNWGAPT